jgi:hypothetical protein
MNAWTKQWQIENTEGVHRDLQGISVINMDRSVKICFWRKGCSVEYTAVFDARKDNAGDCSDDFIIYRSHEEHSFETN